MDELSSLGTVSERGCFCRNARARNTHVEATLNHPFAAQVDRCVLVFSRSRAAPEPPAVGALFDDPGFFLDALYVHAKASEANKVQEVYDALTALAPRSRPLAFFFFETTSSAPRLHQHLAVLLAHPQLRDDQEAVAAKLSRPLCDDGDDRSEVVMSAAC